MTTRADIVVEARTWVGTRWHHQAALKGVGCDCIGLIAGVAGSLGLPEATAWLADARRKSYGRAPVVPMLLGAAAEYLLEIYPHSARAGDVILMRPRADISEPQHFGILSEDGPPRRLIHARMQSRKVVETTFDDAMASLCVRAYRYRGIT